MFELGPEKVFVILAAAFVLLGPKELPAAARKIGATMQQLRSLQDALRAEVTNALDSAEPAQHEESSSGTTGPADESARNFDGPSSFV